MRVLVKVNKSKIFQPNNFMLISMPLRTTVSVHPLQGPDEKAAETKPARSLPGLAEGRGPDEGPSV